MASMDGFMWTPTEGRQDGLMCIGKIYPPHYEVSFDSTDYDVIVIGSGYAGLTAARDLSIQGKKTLLVEARDRIGGRTWHSIINGFNYEMGGTWLHWHMPHIYREVSFYGLENDWIVTQNEGGKEDYSTLTMFGDQRDIDHSTEENMFGKVWQTFCDMDGEDLRKSYKFALAHGTSEQLQQWDKLSCQDRIEQIRSKLSEHETGLLTALLLQIGGGPLEKMGLLDALRWWALGAHTPTGLNDIALHTRLRSGQSTLHRRMFDHAKSTGYLSYSFKSPVAEVQDHGSYVTVSTGKGQSWRARHVICTVPLNVLSSVKFDPPLHPAKMAAAREGSVNMCNKVHLEISRRDLLSWSGWASPGKGLVAAFGDCNTPEGKTHVVAFGPDPTLDNGIQLADIDAIKSSFMHLLPVGDVSIDRIVTHDWKNDPYSKGTWCYLPPQFISKYLDDLQKTQGNIWFASADWSDGWRGWIDGAVQIGTKAAAEVINVQRQETANRFKSTL